MNTLFTQFAYPASGGLVNRTDPDRWFDVINVKEMGAKGDGQEVRDAAVNNGSTTLTSVSGFFASTDVGKSIWIVGGNGAGTILKTTIAVWVSATQITLTAAPTNPSPVTGVKIVWGTDDTAAITAAITSGAGTELQPAGVFGRRGKCVWFPDGVYLHSGLVVKARTALVGVHSSKSILKLLPNANKTSVTNTNGNDDYICLQNITIDGGREFQLPTNSVLYHGISLTLGSGTSYPAPDNDLRHVYQNLVIQNCGGDGFQVLSAGNTTPGGDMQIANVRVYRVNRIGFNLTWQKTRFEQLVAGYCGTNCFKLTTFNCHFVGCKGFWGGQNFTTVQSDMANWWVDGWGSIFTSCESRESYASGFYITGGNHQFIGCRSDDSGDLGNPAQNLTSGLFSGTIAGFYLHGGTTYLASDNNFVGCHVGMALTGFPSAMSNAVYIDGNADFNQGTVYTQQVNDPASLPGQKPTYSQGKAIVASTGGIASNTLAVDGGAFSAPSGGGGGGGGTGGGGTTTATVFFPAGNNIAGGDFGVVGGGYTLPLTTGTPDEATYFQGKGFKLIRMPFFWGRIQPGGIGTALAQDHINWMTNVCSTWPNLTFMWDCHNYGFFPGPPGQGNSAICTSAMLSDLWTRIANLLKGFPNAAFGLMNEPSGNFPTQNPPGWGGTDSTWASFVTNAVTAIRGTGATNLISVPFTTNGQNWPGPGTDNNDTAFRAFNDSNFIFEIHQYFDVDGSGTDFVTNVPAGTATQRLTAVTNWARNFGKHLYLGEFGTGSSANQLATLQECLQFLNANNDVWKAWTYWAAGSGWDPNYGALDEPTSHTTVLPTLGGMSGDRAQTTTLVANFLTQSSGTPPPALHMDQNAQGPQVSSGTTCTVSISTTNANELILVYIVLNNVNFPNVPITVTSVTDTSGLTWHFRARAAQDTSNPLEEWYAVAPNAITSTTITATASGPVSFASASAVSIGGQSASPFDNATSVTGTTDPVTITTTSQFTIVIGGFETFNNAQSGFNQVSRVGGIMIEFQQFSSIQTNLSVATNAPGAANVHGVIVEAIH